MIRGKDKVIAICLFIISIGISMGQSYYGKHGLGKLNFINDTTTVADFFHASNGIRCTDTCKVYSNGDTLFLTTKTTWLYKVYLYTEPIEKQNILWLESAFKYGKSLSDYYQWSNGTPLAGWYDSVSEMHYIECLTPFYKNAVNIIVLSQFGKYSRVAFYTKSTDYFYTIGLKQNPLYWEGWTGIVLDQFPLLVKGNRLVPCDDLKQVHCWIDNGFFFPIMKKNKHHRPFDYKATIYRGLQDLPFGILPVKHSIPKKYFDYFYNEDNMQYFPAVIEENTQKDTDTVNLSDESLYNLNDTRIKNDNVYARPYQKEQNRSGLCYFIDSFPINIIEEKPKFNHRILVLKNDTIYNYTLIINEKDSSIASVKLSYFFVKYTAKKWVGIDEYGYIHICKFRQIKKHSIYYILFSKQIFISDAEMGTKKRISYTKNAEIVGYYVSFLGCAYSSNTLKRGIHKKNKDVIMINDIVNR